ncbi:MAG: cobalamin biosynthesis protein CobW [Synechococcales cyanobacterium RM1_1_8]|nr:cobalamin biosynthesis protein CobW [Synechococcales cyanobacterium RM1_1_8]
MHKIPVTVITGFLGAGKTTLVRNLLQNAGGRRIAVLVNEFGEVGIDGDLIRDCGVCDDPPSETGISNQAANPSNIVELTNGCLCCTVQEEFLPTMEALLKRREQIDCMVIETSGLALPKPLIQAFRWPEVRRGATVDGVVTVVDCVAVAAGQFASDLDGIEAQRRADDSLDHETPLEELFEDQLACADLVLLTKVDQVDAATREKVEAWLKTELPAHVKVIPCHQGQVAAEVLLGFNAAVEDNLAARPSHHDHEAEHEHDENVTAVAWESDQTFEPRALVAKLQQLTQREEIYRIKGFVHVAQKPMRLVLQGVGNRFDYFFDRPWGADEPRQTRLVFIGEGVTEVAIAQALTA